MTRPGNEHPMSPEEAWQARIAIAARDQAAADVKGFLRSHELKKWCIEKGVEAMKTSSVWFNDSTNETRFYAEECARRFYKFLTED